MRLNRNTPTPREQEGNAALNFADTPLRLSVGETGFNHDTIDFLSTHQSELASAAFNTNLSPTETTIAYINATYRDVWVTTRDGIPTRIPSTTHVDAMTGGDRDRPKLLQRLGALGKHEFIIVRTFRYSQEALREVLAWYRKTFTVSNKKGDFDKKGRAPSLLQKELYTKASQLEGSPPTMMPVTFTQYIRIPLDELLDDDGHNCGSYHYATDLWISTDAESVEYPHTYSGEQAMAAQLGEAELEKCFGLRLEYVVNKTEAKSDRPNKLFFNILGHVFTVTSRVNQLLEDGIHIHHTKDSVGTSAVMGVVQNFTPIADIDGGGFFFASRLDAQTQGNPEGAMRNEDIKLQTELREKKGMIARMENERAILMAEHTRAMTTKDIDLENLKAEAKRTEQEVQRENAENKRLAQEREKDLENFKLEKEKIREELKDHYETRSHRRKDASEDHKFFYAIAISAAGLLFGIVGTVLNIMGKSKALAIAMAFV